MLGLACGDALGRPIEFKTQNMIEQKYGRVTEMLGNGSHSQPAGTITDDTELALCIAHSLVERRKFDPADIGDRFVDWFQSGPFDIGLMTSDSLGNLANGTPWHQAGKEVYAARAEGQNAGNGSVMRCAPLALAYADDTESLVAASRQSSAITHYDRRCRDGCAVLNLTIRNCLQGQDSPLDQALDTLSGDLSSDIETALRQIPDDVTPMELATNGYVVNTLQTALYWALTADNVKEAIVEAVNRCCRWGTVWRQFDSRNMAISTARN
jgi:ADP-ribosyl-[dinitrogen reductase] hydrolase